MLRRTTLTIAALAEVLAGCSTSGYEAVINDEAAQQTMLPKHADFDNPGPLQRALMGDRKAQQAKLDDAEQRIARLEKQLETGQRQPADAAAIAPAARQGLATKIGVLLDPALAPALQTALQQALAAAEREHPVVVVPTAEIERQLAAYGCQRTDIPSCADRLATYPGLHFLAEVSGMRDAPLGRAVTTVRLYDVAHATAQTPSNVALQAADGEIRPAALAQLADRIVLDVLAASRSTPWSTRAFNREGNEIFIAAGARSGLQPGTVLNIHGEERVVRSPTGTIAGRIPGQKKGSMKVTRLFGDDYAVAERVSGELPAPEDRLLPADQQDNQQRR